MVLPNGELNVFKFKHACTIALAFTGYSFLQWPSQNVNWGGGGGGTYSYIHVLPDKFLLKLNSSRSVSKEICQAEHDYIPLPINVLPTRPAPERNPQVCCFINFKRSSVDHLLPYKHNEKIAHMHKFAQTDIFIYIAPSIYITNFGVLIFKILYWLLRLHLLSFKVLLNATYIGLAPSSHSEVPHFALQNLVLL